MPIPLRSGTDCRCPCHSGGSCAIPCCEQAGGALAPRQLLPDNLHISTDAMLEAEIKRLQAEVERRDDLKKKQEQIRREKNAELWKSKVDVLLDLVPGHSRTSCSDDNTANDDRGCTRCYLIYAQRYDWDYDKKLVIRIENYFQEL